MKSEAIWLIIDETLELGFHARRDGNFIACNQYRKHHAKLQQCQRLSGTVVCSIPKRNKCVSSKNEFRLRRPTFGNKLIRPYECTRILVELVYAEIG